MASAYTDLLDAAIRHLTDLRGRGVQFVDVSPESLALLQRPAQGRFVAPAASPAPRGRPSPSAPSPPLPTPPTAPPAPAFRPAPPPRPTAAPGPAPTPAPAPVAVAATAPLPTRTGDKAADMAALREKALTCQLCPHLVGSRTQVVFGVGSLDAALMFIGEAPGADEDRLGEPFVGRAGQLLTKIIGAMGESRSSVYIANILKCRPDMPPGATGNRAPRPEEMDTCKPYLLAQIEIIRPKLIVALGLTAVQGLLGLRTTMGAVRGRWQDFRGVPVMPTFHPSYLIRAEKNPDQGYGEKRKTWEDMLQVLGRLERPITDKMRGYFLKPPATGGNA